MVSANTFEEEMLGKLRFKSSLFEGVLDGGEDTIFATDSKFKKMMEELSQTMNSSENTSSEEDQPIDKNEEEKPVDNTSIVSRQEDENSDTETATADREAATASIQRKAEIKDAENSDIAVGNPATAPHPQCQDARKLVKQGMSFFSGLTEMLKSPLATKHLIDTLVEENQETGETHIRIPVPDRNTVVKFLDAITGLLSSQGK